MFDLSRARHCQIKQLRASKANTADQKFVDGLSEPIPSSSTGKTPDSMNARGMENKRKGDTLPTSFHNKRRGRKPTIKKKPTCSAYWRPIEIPNSEELSLRGDSGEDDETGERKSAKERFQYIELEQALHEERQNKGDEATYQNVNKSISGAQVTSGVQATSGAQPMFPNVLSSVETITYCSACCGHSSRNSKEETMRKSFEFKVRRETSYDAASPTSSQVPFRSRRQYSSGGSEDLPSPMPKQDSCQTGPLPGDQRIYENMESVSSGYSSLSELLAESGKGLTPSPRVFKQDNPPIPENVICTRCVQKRSKKLQSAVDELLNTEMCYLSKLRLIDDGFKNELIRRNGKEQIVKDDVIPHIFSCISSIRRFHEEFLVPEYEKCFTPSEERGCVKHRIGKIFCRKGPFLKMYAEYIWNYNSCCKTLQHCRKSVASFEKFVTSIEQSRKDNLGLEHHMLQPIQRLTRYPLLLEQYVKYLPADSSDLLDAKRAVELMKSTALKINDASKINETFSKVLQVQRRLMGSFNILRPSRELIKEGKLNTINPSSGESEDRYAVLFNDLILVCKNFAPGMSSLKLITKVYLAGIKIIHSPKDENMFYLLSKKIVIEFKCSDEQDKDDWMNAIQRVSKEFTESVHSIIDASVVSKDQVKENRLGSVAPIWTKDQNAKNCMECGREFRMWRRKHHCRACGKLVCADCSEHRLSLEYHESDEKLRICDSCFKKLDNFEKSSSCDDPNQTKEDSWEMVEDELLGHSDYANITSGRVQGSSSANEHSKIQRRSKVLSTDCNSLHEFSNDENAEDEDDDEDRSDSGDSFDTISDEEYDVNL